MLRNIKNSYGTIIRKKEFLVAFLLMLSYVAFFTIKFYETNVEKNALYLSHPAMISPLFFYDNNTWIFAKYYQFLIVLPAGFIFVDDRKSGIDKYMISRVGVIKYYVSKAFAAALASSMMVVVPLILGYIVNLISIPEQAARTMSGSVMYTASFYEETGLYMFGDVLAKNVYLYAILMILVAGLLAFCSSMLVIGISTFNIRYKVILFLPLYVVFLVTEKFIAPKYIGNASLSQYILNYSPVENRNDVFFFCLMGVMFLIGVICMSINMLGRRKLV